MLFVPVVSKSGKPLMPCHPARARELVRSGQALRRFNKGLFYIKLIDREDGDTQPIAVGIDPGSKREAFTVKSAAHTFLNIQAHAVTWVKDAIEVRRNMRKARRNRNTPCRANHLNRSIRKQLPPSTKARWQWKLRIARWLTKLYPIFCFVIEDVAVETRKGQRKWNQSFSPIEIGKHWFYKQISTLAKFETKAGYETKELRDVYGLKKSKRKLSERFDAHCVDSWVLANWFTGGHTAPDSTRMLAMESIQFHRRQLHRLQPESGGVRKLYGSTRSNGFKRGSLVKHIKYGLVYVGGCLKKRISLHSLSDGVRLTQKAKTGDCLFLTYNSWRTCLLSEGL
jgi:RRXRR protein